MSLLSPLAPPMRGVEALAASVVLAWGWPRRLIAVAAGAVGALALPPLGLWPAMVIPMTIAVWLIDGAADASPSGATRWASLRAAFGAGWWWGFGYFVAGLWWLGAAFLVDADQYLWALPLGVVALPAALALFPALGFALARALWPRDFARPLALAFALSASEFLRAHAFGGFPWNEYGMALGQSLPFAQIAAYVGLHGLTVLTVAIFAAPATLAGSPSRIVPTAFAVIALAAIGAFGLWRLSEPAPAPVANAKLRLMQANISQGADFSPARGEAIVSAYLKLSDRASSPERTGVADVTHLIWPESAFPFILSRDPLMMARIADYLRGGAVLITGAARADDSHGSTRYYNSIEVLDAKGLEAPHYDKRRLVPFGEFLPFRNLLERLGVTAFVQAPGGFSPGAGGSVLAVPGLPDALAMICYEAIFPNELRARMGSTADVAYILNLTDDGWFGNTAGPYQHFAQARLRAIELGLPLVRAANTGISAIVDARGRVEEEAPLGVETVVDGRLPGALPPTWQARWGAATFAVMLLLCGLASLASRRR